MLDILGFYANYLKKQLSAGVRWKVTDCAVYSNELALSETVTESCKIY